MSKKKSVTPVVLPLYAEAGESMKLTRSELIDLIIDEAIEKNRARQVELGKLLEEAQKVAPEKLGCELIRLANASDKPLVKFDQWYGDQPRASLSVNLNPKNLWTPEEIARLQQIKAEITATTEAAHALNDRSRAKSKIMKQLLENSEDGRALLEQVKMTCFQLESRLLTAAKP